MKDNKEIISGFTFCVRGRDYFIPSNLVKRSKKLARKICKKICVNQSEKNIQWIYDHMQKCDKEETTFGYKICGDRYGNRFTLYIPYNEREDYIELEVV